MSLAYSNYFTPLTSNVGGSNSHDFNFNSIPNNLNSDLNHPSPAVSQEDSSENSNSPLAHSLEDGLGQKDLSGGKDGNVNGSKKIGRQKSSMTNAERRATHNAIERARRESLNGRFLQLAEALPSMSNVKRPSKSIIVNKSLEYITESVVREQMLIKENFELRREVDELRARLGMPQLPPSPLSLQLSASVNHHHHPSQMMNKEKKSINPANIPLPQTPVSEGFQAGLTASPMANHSMLAANPLASQWKSAASMNSPSINSHPSQNIGSLNFGFPTSMHTENQGQASPNSPNFFGLPNVSSPMNPGFNSFGMNQQFDFSSVNPHHNHNQIPIQVPLNYGGFQMMLNSPQMGGYFPTSNPNLVQPMMPRMAFDDEIKKEEGLNGMIEEENEKDSSSSHLVDESDGESRSRGSSVGKEKLMDPAIHPLTSALGIEIFSPVKYTNVPGSLNKKISSTSSLSSSMSAVNDETNSSLSSSLGSLKEGKNLNGWFAGSGSNAPSQEPFSLFSSF